MKSAWASAQLFAACRNADDGDAINRCHAGILDYAAMRSLDHGK
jgi:hypothetical protein